MRRASLILLSVVALLCVSCSSARREPLTIPFELVRNEILLELRVNGHGPLVMMLDTGVTPSVIDREAAQAAGIPLDDARAANAEGVGTGEVSVVPADWDDLQIGAGRFGPITAIGMDLSPISEKLGRRIDGILGHSFLDGRVVRIDYQRATLEISSKALPRLRGTEAVELPLEFVQDDVIPLIPALEVNGRSIPVSLDTGASLTLEIFPEGVEQLGLASLLGSARAGSLTGARGEVATRKATVERISLGPLALQPAEVTFSQRRAEGGRLGNVGNGFLRHFVLTLDYRNQTLRLERRVDE